MRVLKVETSPREQLLPAFELAINTRREVGKDVVSLLRWRRICTGHDTGEGRQFGIEPCRKMHHVQSGLYARFDEFLLNSAERL